MQLAPGPDAFLRGGKRSGRLRLPLHDDQHRAVLGDHPVPLLKKGHAEEDRQVK